MKEFKVLSSRFTDDLNKEVSEHLNDGWKLHGFTASTPCQSWSHFEKQSEYTLHTQSVVREKNET